MTTLLKCKMCGGTLEIQDNETVARCKYCGSIMTIPRVDTEKKARIFDRANEYRLNAEFDQAFEAYKAIATENPEEPEAYWGMVLSEYGIEYVEDPKTGKRVPTCHRASPTSIKNSSNFKLAVQYADAEQKMMYEDEAKEIDQIQKRILAVSAREEPYDVFICYKETDDATGERTTDSVLAQNIYDELVRKNIRTFFSRITLEDKLGVDYEPYIYAALRSAKVMLVVTENPDNCEAVWVKNEWMRFLNFMKEDSSKTIIPVYQKITAYELPSELARFQAQDMSKIGAIQDLVRGVRKLIRPNTEAKYTVIPQVINATDTAPLLKRAFIFLEDGNFQEADEYCEKVLDMDPENANAYLGKLLAEKQLSELEELKNLAQPFDSNNNYQKILRYGDSELIASVKNCIDFINNRNKTERLTGIYNDALNKMNTAKSEEEYKAAARVFNTLNGFKDSDVLAQKCLNRAEETRKDNIYSTALSHMKAGTVSEYKKAISLFRSIPGWKDAERKINECQIKIDDLHAKEEAERIRKEHQKAVAKQTAKRAASFVTPMIAVGIILAIVVVTIIRPRQKVNEARELIEAGKIEEGYIILEGMGKQNLIKQNMFDRAISFIENGDYTAASELLAETNGDEKIAAKRYSKAIEYIDNENLIAAYYLLDGLDYKDSKEHLATIGDDVKAIQTIKSLSDAEIGSVIQYGSYEQDGNSENGKEAIEWTVLAKEEDKALLIAKNGLSHQPYNSTLQDISWEKSSLRTWLNETFINEAFNSSEQSMILGALIKTEDNPVYGTSAGEDAIDKVFILSIDEAQSYFNSDDERKLGTDKYGWWLRSPGSNNTLAAQVNPEGEIITEGTAVDNSEIAICPALWVSSDLNILNSIELTRENWRDYLDITGDYLMSKARPKSDSYGEAVLFRNTTLSAISDRVSTDMQLYGVVVEVNFLAKYHGTSNFNREYLLEKTCIFRCDSEGKGEMSEEIELETETWPLDQKYYHDPSLSNSFSFEVLNVTGRVALKENQSNKNSQEDKESSVETAQNELIKKCEEEIVSGNYKEANNTLSQIDEMGLSPEYDNELIKLAEKAMDVDNPLIVKKILEIIGDAETNEALNNYLVFDEISNISIVDSKSLSHARELLDSLPEDYAGVRDYKDLINLYGDYVGTYNGHMGDDILVFISKGRAGVEKTLANDHAYYFTYPNLFTDDSQNGNKWTLISTDHVQRSDDRNRVLDYADYRR